MVLGCCVKILPLILYSVFIIIHALICVPSQVLYSDRFEKTTTFFHTMWLISLCWTWVTRQMFKNLCITYCSKIIGLVIRSCYYLEGCKNVLSNNEVSFRSIKVNHLVIIHWNSSVVEYCKVITLHTVCEQGRYWKKLIYFIQCSFTSTNFQGYKFCLRVGPLYITSSSKVWSQTAVK